MLSCFPFLTHTLSQCFLPGRGPSLALSLSLCLYEWWPSPALDRKEDRSHLNSALPPLLNQTPWCQCPRAHTLRPTQHYSDSGRPQQHVSSNFIDKSILQPKTSQPWWNTLNRKHWDVVEPPKIRPYIQPNTHNSTGFLSAFTCLCFVCAFARRFYALTGHLYFTCFKAVFIILLFLSTYIWKDSRSYHTIHHNEL